MKKIKSKDYYSILEECFKSDEELITKWHIESEKGLLDCINRTFNDFKTFEKNGFEFYLLKDNNNLIGFYGIENNNFLTTLFVKPEYRKKYNKKIWNIIKTEFNGSFTTALWSKNHRAIKFMIKNGAKFKNDGFLGKDHFIVLEFN